AEVEPQDHRAAAVVEVVFAVPGDGHAEAVADESVRVGEIAARRVAPLSEDLHGRLDIPRGLDRAVEADAIALRDDGDGGELAFFVALKSHEPALGPRGGAGLALEAGEKALPL